MKKQQLTKKLTLNKETISNLSKEDQKKIYGRRFTFVSNTCESPAWDPSWCC